MPFRAERTNSRPRTGTFINPPQLKLVERVLSPLAKLGGWSGVRVVTKLEEAFDLGLDPDLYAMNRLTHNMMEARYFTVYPMPPIILLVIFIGVTTPVDDLVLEFFEGFCK